MAHPYHHSLSSVKKWGGAVDDYLPIHNWFDVIWTVKPRCRATIKVRQQGQSG
jgi:hypothetical protein